MTVSLIMGSMVVVTVVVVNVGANDGSARNRFENTGGTRSSPVLSGNLS